jgi:outer membrane protein TolC
MNADRRSISRAIAILALALTQVSSFAEGAIPIDLDKARDMAKRNTASLRLSRARLAAERDRIRLSAWEYLPTLGLNLSDSRTTRYAATDAASIAATGTLTLPVTQGGRRRMRTELASLAVGLEGLNLESSEEDIEDSCFSLFHETRVLELKLESLIESRKIVEGQYEIAKTEFELGKIREIDLIETKASVASVAQEVFAAETELLSAEYSLKRLLGLERGARIELVTDIDSGYAGFPVRGSAEKLKGIAEARNQDILKTRYKVEEARLNARIAASEWNPNVSLSGSMSLSGDQYPLQKPNYGLRATVEFPSELLPLSVSLGFTTSPDLEYGRSANASVSTPSSLDTIVDRRLAQVSLGEAIEARESAARDAVFLVEQRVLEYERLRGEQRLIADKLAILERKSEIMRVQLELGYVTRSDYLEGENELLTARLDRLSGVLSLMEAERQIERVAGLKAGELKGFEDKNDEK